MTAGQAYFVAYILTVRISEANLNPATTFALYLHDEKVFKQWKMMLLLFLVQIIGSYVGILISYLMIKPINEK